jgi:cell division septation protein DedD
MRNTGICLIATMLGALLLSACSRETADWKSASTADTAEAYQQFLTQHPKAPNAAAAQARLKALSEDHDWQVAAAADTRLAYEQFVAAHADSKWAQEARIRIENFAQNGASSNSASSEPATPPTPPAPAKSAAPRSATSGKVASASAKPAAKSGASAHGNFVQLGAFSSRERAQSEWKTLAARFPTELKSLKPDYVQGTSKHGTVFRLRVPVSSVAAAKGLCGTLKKHSQLCVPVTA